MERSGSLRGLPAGDRVLFCCCFSVSGCAEDVISATTSCCVPAAAPALRSCLWACHVRGEITFSHSFLSSDFLPDLCLMQSINATSPLALL